MINKNLIQTSLEQLEEDCYFVKDIIKQNALFYIFPFSLQGCVNVTERGIKPEALNIGDYTYFSKVIDGLHPVVATWDKSTRWLGTEDRFKWMQKEKGARKEYRVGRYFKGLVESETIGLNINTAQTYGINMSSLQAEEKITLLTTEKIEKEDIFKLFIIKHWDRDDYPGITENTRLNTIYDKNKVQFLFLAACSNFYSPKGKFIYSQLTFSSLNDRLADTGYSIANYTQLSLIGAGYAWPMLKREVINKKVKITVEIDDLKTIDVGVWGLQIQVDNTAIIHSVRALGYPINWDSEDMPLRNGIVFAPRLLLPKYFIPPVNHPLNTQLKAEERYLMILGIQPEITFYAKWLENKRSSYDESIKSSYEGMIRTNYKISAEYAEKDIRIYQNPALQLTPYPSNIPLWPEWLVVRTFLKIEDALLFDFLDTKRSIFSNIFNKKLPEWGNVNPKIEWKKVKDLTWANILSLNAITNHDMLTLPLGLNQNLTVELEDVISDATSRIPKVGNWIKDAILGFSTLLFGKAPIGWKRGGYEDKLKYLGSQMMGLMSEEMYLFYTGPYNQSKDETMKGVIPYNLFQDQSGEPLSTLLNASSNATALSFKLTDIIKCSIYDTSLNKEEAKARKRTEYISTVHLAQFPYKELNWKKTETAMVDEDFSVTIDPRELPLDSTYSDEGPRFRDDNVDNQRLYVINEISIQAIGAGNITVIAFSQDPTEYSFERVAIWEGKFRNTAKVSKSTRAFTTTIRLGQPRIEDEDGRDYKYEYPRTILSDIQNRPNLPPPVWTGRPEDAIHIGTFITSKSRKEKDEEGLIRLKELNIETAEGFYQKKDNSQETRSYLSWLDQDEGSTIQPLLLTAEKNKSGFLSYYQKGEEVWVSLYHETKTDEPRAAVKQLQNNNPLFDMPLSDWEENITIDTLWKTQRVIIQQLNNNRGYQKYVQEIILGWDEEGEVNFKKETEKDEKLPEKNKVDEEFWHAYLELEDEKDEADLRKRIKRKEEYIKIELWFDKESYVKWK